MRESINQARERIYMGEVTLESLALRFQVHE